MAARHFFARTVAPLKSSSFFLAHIYEALSSRWRQSC